MNKCLLLSILSVICTFGGSAFASENLPREHKETKHVRLLHLGDMHAQLETHWEYLPEDPSRLFRMGGFARLKTALDRNRADAQGAVFVVDGGDTFQGSALAAWTQGQAILDPLNALGIDIGIPGNWEVVYGPQVFRDLMSKVTYKVLAYNFEDTATGNRLFAPAVTMNQKGVKIAFIGQTDITTTTRQPPAQVRGLDSTKSSGLKEFVQELRKREEPDLVVLVDHNGLTPMVQVATEIPEIDVILSNHTHERVYKPIRVGNTVIVEPGSMGSFLGRVDLVLQGHRVVDVQYKLIPVHAEQFAEDKNVKTLVEKAKKPFEKRLNKVIGHTATSILRYDVLESNMDNLVADAVRKTTRADVAFTNGFRFSPPIGPGPITEGDLWNILPLDAKLKVGTITGAQLRDYLEHEMELVFSNTPAKLSGGWGPRPSGLTLKFVARANEGARIKEVLVAGQPLDLKKEYSIGGCDREGEPLGTICRVKEIKGARYLEGSVHSALRDYIRLHSPLKARREGRVRATDLPDQVWSQYGLLQEMWNLPGSAEGVRVPAART